MATTTSITSTYAGEFAGEYIANALLESTTLANDLITVKQNIKYKQVVKHGALADIIADASCDFADTGTVSLTERILTPKELKVNVQLCKLDFVDDWEAASMGMSANGMKLPPKFSDFLMKNINGSVGASTETSIWHGVAATAGQFGGFVPLMTADDDVIDVEGTTITASNVIAELGKLVDAIPSKLYGKEDLYGYIPQNVARAYIRAMGALGYKDEFYAGSKPLEFDGLKLVIANGLNSNYMVAGQKSNLWFGTGLMRDMNSVRILDQEPVDGSDNVNIVMKYTAGVQYGVGSELVLYTPV